MFCKRCGQPIADNAKFCPSCGQKFEEKNANDESSIALAVLSFFFPILGIILYFIYEHDCPKRAKSCIKGAVIGFICWVIFWVIISILTTVLPFILPFLGLSLVSFFS